MGFAPNEQLGWSRSRSALLASICVVTGFANVWRFPSLMVEHGGPAFLLVYVVALLLLAFPVIWLQWRLGQAFPGNQATSLTRLGRVEHTFSLWHVAGGAMLITCALLASIYLVISSVGLAHLFKAAFGAFLGIDRAGAVNLLYQLQADSVQMSGWIVVFALPATVILVRGQTRGLERSLPVLVGSLALLFLLLVFSSLWKAGPVSTWQLLNEGTPELWRPGLWMDAIAQAFFSLALGSGVHIMLGSYAHPHARALPIIGTMLGVDLLTGLASTLIIVPLVLHSDLNVADGFTLVFQILPVALQATAGGQFHLTLFYLLLALVGLTSLLFLLEALVLWLQTRLSLKRRSATLATLLAVGGVALLLAQSMVADENGLLLGMPWFVFMQFLVSSVLLPAALLFVLFLVAYILPHDRLSDVLGLEGRPLAFLEFYRWLRYVVIPLVLMVQIASLGALLKHWCFLGSGFAGSICSLS